MTLAKCWAKKSSFWRVITVMKIARSCQIDAQSGLKSPVIEVKLSWETASQWGLETAEPGATTADSRTLTDWELTAVQRGSGTCHLLETGEVLASAKSLQSSPNGLTGEKGLIVSFLHSFYFGVTMWHAPVWVCAPPLSCRCQTRMASIFLNACLPASRKAMASKQNQRHIN